VCCFIALCLKFCSAKEGQRETEKRGDDDDDDDNDNNNNNNGLAHRN
jgi:hypothetical protein